MFAYLILTVIWRRAEQVLESFGLVFFNLFFREGGREEVGGGEKERETSIYCSLIYAFTVDSWTCPDLTGD